MTPSSDCFLPACHARTCELSKFSRGADLPQFTRGNDALIGASYLDPPSRFERYNHSASKTHRFEPAMPLTESIERLTFSEAFPDDNNLRNLARRIAGLSFEQASPLISEADRWPYNFLAHGEAQSPPLHCSGSGSLEEQIARAKFHKDQRSF